MDGQKGIDYLEKRIQRVTESGCWIWEKCVDREGYGRSTFNCKKTRMNRLAWMSYKGPIPDGLCVLHRCDVRECVNPDHLFLGTIDDNNKDMHRKKRNNQCKGEDQGGSILTEEQVIFAFNDPRSSYEVGRLLGVSYSTIGDIRRGRNWKHLNLLTTKKDRRLKLTEDQIQEIRESSGPSRSIGKKYGVGKNTILNIRKGKSWAKIRPEQDNGNQEN